MMIVIVILIAIILIEIIIIIIIIVIIVILLQCPQNGLDLANVWFHSDNYTSISNIFWGEFLKRKEAIESKGLNRNHGKTKVCGGITKDGMSKSKVDPMVSAAWE